MTLKIHKKTFLTIIATLFSCLSAFAQNDHKICLGAYYFDGWTGTYPYHITKRLTDSFPERKPVWGWQTSTQAIMDEQINVASAGGLDFFNFCWYYKGKDKYKKEPLNHALQLYLDSKNKSKLRFCIMVTNNHGFDIGPKDWPDLTAAWIDYFKADTYLKIDGKPFLLIYYLPSLLQSFGSAANIRSALDGLREAAKKNGLGGVTIGLCTNPVADDLKLAESCGFDVLTGYNYYGAGFKGAQQQIPIDSLKSAEVGVWDKFPALTHLKYIPVSSLNWDPRPWATAKNQYDQKKYYTGYSRKSVAQSVVNCVKWLNKNPESATKEKIAVLYAWNENGEGAWLTPSEQLGHSLLEGVKDGLKK